MNMALRRRALVFDLDGTLIDSAPDLHAALNRVLAEAGRRPVDLAAIKAMVGDGAARLIERGFAETGAPPPAGELAALVQCFLVHYERDIVTLTRPFPEVATTLERLAGDGYRLGICTNKPERLTRLILDGLGLVRYFGAVQGSDSGPVRKPDPGHLRATLAELGATTGEAAMVGDSANDVAVARAAAVPAIVVSYGYSRVPAGELGADAVIDAFAELPALLDRLPARR